MFFRHALFTTILVGLFISSVGYASGTAAVPPPMPPRDQTSVKDRNDDSERSREENRRPSQRTPNRFEEPEDPRWSGSATSESKDSKKKSYR